MGPLTLLPRLIQSGRHIKLRPASRAGVMMADGAERDPVSTSGGSAQSPPALPAPEQVLDLLIAHTCTRKCFGRPGYAASCCHLADRDFIIGPIHDSAAALERLRQRLGSHLEWHDVFIDFAEGSALFRERASWQNPANFPALRVRTDDGGRFACRFLGENQLCTIHDIRPATCRSYQCEHLQKVVALL